MYVHPNIVILIHTNTHIHTHTHQYTQHPHSHTQTHTASTFIHTNTHTSTLIHTSTLTLTHTHTSTHISRSTSESRGLTGEPFLLIVACEKDLVLGGDGCISGRNCHALPMSCGGTGDRDGRGKGIDTRVSMVRVWSR